MNAVKLLEKCEVYDEINGGSGRDPDLYFLNICELLVTLKYLSVCLKFCIVTQLSIESSEIFLRLFVLV